MIDETDETETQCPACGSFEFSELGTLGVLYWVRCNACGIDIGLSTDDGT